MKKSTVAIGVIVILGAAYVGASWYTGNVIENNIERKVAEFTQKINDYQDEENVTISYSDYQKGIFSTKLHLTVTASPKQEVRADEKPITLFNDDITIHHGPFPLSALASGNFAPQMAWGEYQMTEKASPELWQLAGNKPFITAYMGMSYQEYLKLNIVNKALTVTESSNSELLGCQSDSSSDCKLDISAGNISVESDKDMSNLLMNAQLDKLIYSDGQESSITMNKFSLLTQPNAEKTGISYQFNIGELSVTKKDYYTTPNLAINKIDSKGTVIYTNENVDLQTTVDKITVTPDTRKNSISETIIIDQLTFNQKSLFDRASNKVDGALNVMIGGLFAGKQNLGNGVLDFDFQGIDGGLVSDSLGMPNYSDESLSEDDQLDMKISLNKFNWHNSVGDLNVSAIFGISGDRETVSLFDVENMDMIKLNLDLPFNVLAHLGAQLESPASDTVTEAQLQKAGQSLQMLSQMFLRESDLITFKRGDLEGIYSEVDYAKDRDEVKVNGKTISKEEFLNNF